MPHLTDRTVSLAAPKLVSALVQPGAYLGAVLALAGLILALSGDASGVFWLVLGTFRTQEGICAASTRVSRDGVTQLTWHGRVSLAWTEITAAKRNRWGVTLTGPSGSVRVAVDAFECTDDAVQYIGSHLPTSVVWRH